jgi:hypothetical protein
VLITTPVSTKSSVSKFKIRPNKVYKLVFKRQIIGIRSDFIATQEGIYDVIITKKHTDIGNDCGYTQLVSK